MWRKWRSVGPKRVNKESMAVTSAFTLERTSLNARLEGTKSSAASEEPMIARDQSFRSRSFGRKAKAFRRSFTSTESWLVVKLSIDK